MSAIRRLTSILLVVSATAVAADNARPVYGPAYEDVPANYQFNWEVKDDYTGNDFGQEEARSGYNTDGEYTVLLPDGRKQIVSYRVLDGESGYVADVRYEGDVHPDSYAPPSGYKATPTPAPYRPKPKAPAPYRQPKAYAPRPAYKPRPTYAPATPTPKPEPTYTTAGPSYVPRPVYDPRPPAPYRPKPTYAPRPAPRTYGPKYEPAPTTTPAPVTTTYAPPAPTRRYRPISSYKVSTTTTTAAPEPSYAENEAEEAAPTYNPAQVKKRRMKYVRRLEKGEGSASGSLFYGAVKGRVRAPQRPAPKYDN